ncbi:hypothetical protein H6F67_19645 [Microcoleus sp. FACHB-1515]|uniref:hypothetical protein n=1 Tax=Cyanophyceae TaxID=3028117 RepID=UPI00168811A7|nr:hypothetical protein [Microcoleus sp. FACHB-1515]MBD2092066.1 hypothetical protein [Microcoleus sp. FACHB-1515]
MELFPLIFLLAIAFAELAKDRSEKPKSEEKELGDAMVKYLSKGVKVRIEATDDKK